ncbi:MAG: valine--tRNA ligase [Saprospiraceae bacterium]|nr:valine--tRNA ligase [Saprospiraceae bacterium]
MSEISARYNPLEVEEKWYSYWMSMQYFKSTPDGREPYSVVIPPPNVTGVLHMGHMLNNTIQDVLIRKARQEGKNACWVPGTDHASIATEAKVVRMLRERGIKKADLSRDEFLKYAWEWKEEYGGIILQQLQKLGASCDWDRTAFTMDEIRSDAVYKVFVDLHRRGKLYRKKRMVNWDPEARTVLSNEEVIYGMENSRLFHVKYQIEGTEEYITIATTRPETIPGDTAVAVHPDDPRYHAFHGKRAIVPLIGRAVPIIVDEYVTMDFGTGALKVTPAHDVNDFDLGVKHQLETVDVFNDDGTMSSAAGIYPGDDRFVVRKKFAADLDAAGYIVKIEDYKNNVGRSERTNAVVEPRLSLQWYVDMKALAGPALDAVESDEIEFFPKNQKNLYRHWMENIRDWCISRQLWWGHRVPAWYYGEFTFVAENIAEALEEAKKISGNLALTEADLSQDEDVLDTWFSSWLWPISVFDGFNSKEELNYYYPTSVLVTGWDIIFLWVARMAMAGFEWTGEKPFHDVYFTGMVRDKQRRKMSKQLGNSPDALKLIEDYGADGVRFGMLSCSPAGGDLLFDEKLVEQGRNFCNKLWNAMRLILGWTPDPSIEPTPLDQLAYNWMDEKLSVIALKVNEDFQQYRLSDALMSIYSFIWDDFCSWYLEMVKPGQGEPISEQCYTKTISIFTDICSLLHPFMPFITEEIWHQLKTNSQKGDCMLSPYPKGGKGDEIMLAAIEHAKTLITAIREVRAKNGLKSKEALPLYAKSSQIVSAFEKIGGYSPLVTKMAGLFSFEITDLEDIQGVNFIVDAEKYFVELQIEIDAAKELEEKQKELVHQLNFVDGILKKLTNERFVAGAPSDVIEKERKKLADGQERIRLLEQEVIKLKGLVN